MSATGIDSRIAPDRRSGLRTNAEAITPEIPLQKRPHAPNTPWGRLRGARGWSLRYLSELSGINPADLSRIERGIGGPNPDQARRLLAVYDGAR